MKIASRGSTPRARWLAWLAVAGLTTAALFAPTAASATTEHCPDGGVKVEANGGNQDAINDLVLEAGTSFCVKGSTDATGVLVADGTTTLSGYLGNDHDVSHYVVYESEPTATPTEEPTATPTEEPTATPTEEPTATPTEEPTATPTEEPTATPTEEPTATPTEEPTATPTGSVAPTESTPPTATPTPAGSVGGATGTPGTTLPPTDVAIDASSSAGDNWRLIVLAMAGILAAALLLTPARSVRKGARD